MARTTAAAVVGCLSTMRLSSAPNSNGSKPRSSGCSMRLPQARHPNGSVSGLSALRRSGLRQIHWAIAIARSSKLTDKRLVISRLNLTSWWMWRNAQFCRQATSKRSARYVKSYPTLNGAHAHPHSTRGAMQKHRSKVPETAPKYVVLMRPLALCMVIIKKEK